MKYIKKYVDEIDDELRGAKEYAEKYVELKASNEPEAGTFKQLAMDEMQHASELHRIAAEEIAKLAKVYTAPDDMQQIWRNSHSEYVERAAWIKQMLTL